ncbi:MAG: ComF family protein [Magnetovibrio sp.]|nr:ComF family protein [Magnetovibrio sp.]
MYLKKNGVFSRVIDVVLPPSCAGCGTQVDAPQTLCSTCWSRVSFLGSACCQACGYPFEYEVPDQTLCGACVREHPPFDRARAALVYDDNTRDLVLGFKHADRTEIANLLAKWMFASGRDLLDDSDLIVPVPLHWTRLFSRRYNQAALLALQLGRLSDVPVLTNALVRKRKTPSQGRMGRGARARNVQGAFAINPRARNQLQGQRIVLVDDVYTTGATVRAVAKVLKRGGATQINVLTLARVVRDFA